MVPLAIVLWVVLQNIIFVLLVVVGAAVISSLIIGWLISRQDAKEQAACSEIRARWQLEASQRQALPPNNSRAISGGNTYILNFYGMPDADQAQIIRRALPRP